MIVNQTLAITWLVISCYGTVNMIYGLPKISRPKAVSESLFWNVGTVFWVVNLIGIAASVLLFNGVTWARYLIGLIALFNLVCGIVPFHFWKRLKPFFKIAFAVLYIVSLITFVIVVGWATNIFKF